MNYKNPYKGDLEKLKIEFENLVKKMKEKVNKMLFYSYLKLK